MARDRQPTEDGRQDILDKLRASAAATFGEEWMIEASVREALEASAHAVWMVGSEPLDPMAVEPYRFD